MNFMSVEMLGAPCYGTGPTVPESYPPMGLSGRQTATRRSKTGVRARFPSTAVCESRCVRMPRQRRLVLPEVATHIIQRGNNKGAVFLGDGDCLAYLHHLRELAASLDCRVHAYCLMTNHVHLLVTPPSLAACISMMRNLGQRYAQYFNRRHARSGTLWEGRFRSCMVESAAYVLACYRYIEINPVRAGMVSTPDAYRWSSHCANPGIHQRGLSSGERELQGAHCGGQQEDRTREIGPSAERGERPEG